jgi:hypothetical protein
LSYADQFREFEENEDKSKEEINAIWFRDNGGCYPEEYLGEELMSDIINKFYEPLSFIRSLLEKEQAKTLDIKITVMPSYEDRTYFTITLDSKKVLIESSWKAWAFWFTDDEFNQFVEEQLRIWKDAISS